MGQMSSKKRMGSSHVTAHVLAGIESRGIHASKWAVEGRGPYEVALFAIHSEGSFRGRRGHRDERRDWKLKTDTCC